MGKKTWFYFQISIVVIDLLLGIFSITTMLLHSQKEYNENLKNNGAICSLFPNNDVMYKKIESEKIETRLDEIENKLDVLVEKRNSNKQSLIL